ncbi:glycosyltransferase [Lacticigenium naphthae]|uniref:glycosyltransferase n=1 Tax=Lacticigenium naphthae TaxID=515351 RepID=UPI00041C8BF7|nr:glycosyltransferase [Lacticigenium naphthae]
MNRKWIVFYISSHGFGHMTRCLAIMEEILETTDYNLYINGGESQNAFGYSYLSSYAERVQFHDLQTDVGLITHRNSLKIDKEKTEKEVTEFTEKWDEIIETEADLLKGKTIDWIVCDISPIGALVADRLGVRSVGLSNFTWVEQYENLHMDPSIVRRFKDAYAHFNRFVEYELSVPMEHETTKVDRLNFVSRKVSRQRVSEIKEKYGSAIMITAGKSVDIEKITIQDYDGTVFYTSGIEVTGSGRKVALPANIIDTQNYIAASEMVIAKAGWGTIAEAINSHRKLVLIEREDTLEDSHSIRELKKRKLALSIKEEELQNIDIRKIQDELDRTIDRVLLNTYSNQPCTVLKCLSIH